MKRTKQLKTLFFIFMINAFFSCGWFSSSPVDSPVDGSDVADGEETGGDAADWMEDFSLIISGTVYEDINGDGDLADGVPVAGVEVRLYKDGGDGVPDGADDAPVATRVTGSEGMYDFLVEEGGACWVAVDSKTIRASAGFNGDFTLDDTWAEQTCGPAGALCADGFGGSTRRTAAGPCYGGRMGGSADDASTLAGAEHVAAAVLSDSAAAEIDFGFSFNVVTEIVDNVDDPVSNRSFQGSLRQFMSNANAVRGENVMRFVPVVEPDREGAGGQWWLISVGSHLPIIEDTGTTIDATAYDLNDGASTRDTNPGELGTGGSVGVDGLALPRVPRPELEIRGAISLDFCFSIEANGSAVRHLSLHAFGDNSSNGVIMISSASGAEIRCNVLGNPPDAFEDRGAGNRTAGTLIYGDGADDVTVENNLLGFSDNAGINIDSSCTGWLIYGNEIRSVAMANPRYDGIDIKRDSEGFTVRGNLFTGIEGSGIDTWQSAGNNTIENNTIESNGFGGVETAGVRLFGTGNSVTRNVIQNNAGPGVLVVTHSDTLDNTPCTLSRIEQNHFGGNGGIAIDLNHRGSNDTGDGVSLNSGGPIDRCGYTMPAGNEGLDFPVITRARLSEDGMTLDVGGGACPGGTVEIYEAGPGAGDSGGGAAYGEGVGYIGLMEVHDNGLFSGHLVVSGMDLSAGISAIAIDSRGNTSEFCVNVPID